MAIFRRTTTTRERLKAIFAKANYTLMEANKYFISMHPDPLVTTIIDTEVIGGMVKFINMDLGIKSYLGQSFSLAIEGSNCNIVYRNNEMPKDLTIKIWNVDSNFTTIEIRCGDDYVSNIEQCPILIWRQQTVKIIMECLSKVIFDQYRIRYANVRKGLF